MIRVLVLPCVVVCLAAAGPAAATHRDYLLAPESVCPNQTDPLADVWDPARVMRCMHNYARAQMGREALRPLESLAWSAQRKALDMGTCDEFSHTACGRETLFWVRRTRFARGHCYRVKENIAYRSPVASGAVRPVMSGWLHSNAHRHILMRPRYRRFGVGLAHGPFFGYPDTIVWVGHFGYRC